MKSRKKKQKESNGLRDEQRYGQSSKNWTLRAPKEASSTYVKEEGGNGSGNNLKDDSDYVPQIDTDVYNVKGGGAAVDNSAAVNTNVRV